MSWHEHIQHAVTNGIGDWASLVGVLISLIGFFYTIRSVLRSKTAAQQAQEAVIKLRQDSSRIDVVAYCTTAVNLLEQIKSLHRQNQLPLIVEKYSALRHTLISIKVVDDQITVPQRSTIQSAIQIFKGLEKKAETAIAEKTESLDVAKTNSIISEQADALQQVLIEVKARIGR